MTREECCKKLSDAWGKLPINEVRDILREHGIELDVETWSVATTRRAADILERAVRETSEKLDKGEDR